MGQVKNKLVFLQKILEKNILEKFLNLSEKGSAVKSLKVDFLHFIVRLPKFLFCVASWSLFDSKAFQRFS